MADVIVSRSGKLALERLGLVPTLRAPLPTADPQGIPVLNDSAGQLILADYLAATQGAPPPDRGPTTNWPDAGS